MIKVVELKRTCWACPSQWEGKTDAGNDVYIRYRWGYLRVDLDGQEIFGKQIDESGWDGIMDYDKLKEIVKEEMELPEVEQGEEWTL